jgi:hypothetical protein
MTRECVNTIRVHAPRMRGRGRFVLFIMGTKAHQTY